MNIGYVVLGFVVGAVLAGGGSWMLLGAVGGAIVGALFGRMVQAERRLAELETELGRQRAGADRGVRSAAPAEPVATERLDEAAGTAPGDVTGDTPVTDEAGADEAWPPRHTPPTAVGRPHATTHDGAPGLPGRPVPPDPAAPHAGRLQRTSPDEPAAGERAADAAAPAGRSGAAPAPDPAGAGSPPPSRPSLAEVGLRRAGRWLTTGNVPVKLGVILSFIGVSFLLKYAIDRELLSVPIEIRLLAVAAGAVAMLVVGWRLRHRARVYALSLQGGGAGILFLTIFAAFRLWNLIPAPLAFGLLVILAAGTGALAVLQSARSLIVLGATGGFLAPVLASTGQGSHVALFSYYLVLNATILGVAWFRAWRELNLLGFVFTFLIGTLWGYRYYRPELFASTEPFLVLYFVFYNAIAILYALRQAPRKVGLVDGTLVFGTPVIAFGLQAALLKGSEHGLAISAAALAMFYVVLATILWRRVAEPQRSYLRTLTESFIALAVAFGTLAIPLALDARWTSAAWALEGAALVWIGTRQRGHLATLAGAALVFFSGAAFFEHGWRHDTGWPDRISYFLRGSLIALAGLFTAYRFERFDPPGADRHPLVGGFYRVLSWGLFGWGVVWWLGTGSVEIGDRAPGEHELSIWLGFLAISAFISAGVGARLDWRKARLLTLGFLPGVVLVGLIDESQSPHHFLHGGGWLAWPAAIAAQAYVLFRLDAAGSSWARPWHLGSVLGLAAWLAVEAQWQVGRLLAGHWDLAVASMVPGLVALLILRARHRPKWPVPRQPGVYRAAAGLLFVAGVIYLAMVSIEFPGDPAPLTYVPVLNPFDLGLLWAALMAWVAMRFVRYERTGDADGLPTTAIRPLQLLLAAAFFVLTTAALVRGVHHVADVPWDFGTLYRSERVQTALSIYWGLLGFVGMIVGARRGWRPLWLAGAGFMALVVLKLFLVDLGNSGTVERIVSFIGIGVLLLVVGYFAPVPPRRPDGDPPDLPDLAKEKPA